MSKKVTSVRLEPELIEKAKAMGLNLSLILENALAKTLKDKKCILCKQTIPSKK